MSDDEGVQQFLEIRETMRKIALYMGLWPFENPGFLYRMIPYCLVSLFVYAILIISNSIAHHISDARLVTVCFGIITINILCILKVLRISRFGKELLWFNRTVTELCNEFLSDGELKKFVLDDVKIFRSFFRVHASLCAFSGTVPIITSLVSVVYQMRHDLHPIKYSLLLPGTYPWNVSVNQLVHGLHFGFEAYSLMWNFYVGALVDVLFSFTILQMTIPLRGMSHALLNLRDDGDYGYVLHKCLIQYRILIKCRCIIQKTYGPIIVFIAVTGPVALCSLAWQVTQMDSMTTLQKMRFAAHGIAKTLQVWSYSWSATNLRGQSETFLDNVYCSQWLGDRRFMNTVLTVLMQRPLIIQAGHMPDVSLNMFVFVMKTTSSYYLLLQTLD
ncbi:uncharacterized protein [Fopius arisanus]|uniref:Odorant receptor n=1 Tax=Fopius arisanus TaxID=64838 RepID=A0A9R1TDZ4_9HYME|nr:PREDICTED: uncharacterized protein LOC105269221 [Fopius arisanus]